MDTSMHAPFSPKFLMGFVRMDPVNLLAKFEVRSFTRSWETKVWVGVANPKSWGSGGRAWRMVPFERAL